LFELGGSEPNFIHFETPLNILDVTQHRSANFSNKLSEVPQLQISMDENGENENKPRAVVVG